MGFKTPETCRCRHREFPGCRMPLSDGRCKWNSLWSAGDQHRKEAAGKFWKKYPSGDYRRVCTGTGEWTDYHWKRKSGNSGKKWTASLKPSAGDFTWSADTADLDFRKCEQSAFQCRLFWQRDEKAAVSGYLWWLYVADQSDWKYAVRDQTGGRSDESEHISRTGGWCDPGGTSPCRPEKRWTHDHGWAWGRIASGQNGFQADRADGHQSGG